MTILIFFAALILASIALPFKFIGILLVFMAIQALFIKLAAHFVMGETPFSQTFKAAILSTIFTLIAMVATVQMLSIGMNFFLVAILAFFAIWLASGVACSIALETTFVASASIALLSSIIGAVAIKFINFGAHAVG